MLKQRPMQPAEFCRHYRRLTRHPTAVRDMNASDAMPETVPPATRGGALDRRARFLSALIACSLILPGAACRTTQPLPPVDLTEPGWSLRHGQAIWHLPNSDTEFAGELTSARHPDGTILLEFTKTPMTLVVARLDIHSWELNFVADNRNYRGRGRPPSRSAWLVLALALAARPLPGHWEWHSSDADSGDWRLTNPKSGEQIRGYWQP